MEVRAALDRLRLETAPAPADGEPPVAGRRLRVLLAEDNPINAVVATKLVERAGHDIFHAWNGEEAMAQALGGGFDLVLMDLQMPELDGLEAKRRLRAAQALAPGGHPLRIYAMTANAMPMDEAQCKEAGMDGFLSKPVNVAKLPQLLSTLAQG